MAIVVAEISKKQYFDLERISRKRNKKPHVILLSNGGRASPASEHFSAIFLHFVISGAPQISPILEQQLLHHIASIATLMPSPTLSWNSFLQFVKQAWRVESRGLGLCPV